jgi:nucleolin
MSVAALEKALKVAKKAYKADKEDKALKKAVKAAKKALEAAKAAEAKDSSSDESVAAPVVDVAALKAALKAAKKAYKADKDNKDLKKAVKAAKKALEEAEAAPAAAAVTGQKRKAEEVETKVEAPATDFVIREKKQKMDTSNLEGTPNPKCFCGNLSFDIDDDTIKEFFKDSGEPTDIYWLTDRDSGKFKGCGFVTFKDTDAAILACQKNGQEVMGRPIKVNFAKPRPGGDKARTPKKPFGKQEMSEKPEGCVTVFCGNLSFDIDDDKMTEFASGCGEISRIRWLTDRDSGDFKGCGFIDFTTTEAVDAFVKLNGNDLMGRNIRIDYAKARPPRN